ncbi:MAG TPA: PPC domain-containing protein [Humisphaera sp.]
MPLFRKTARRDTAARAPRPTATIEGLEGRIVFNNTLPTATDLGTVFGEVTKTDSVSSSDTLDHYKVKLAATGKLWAKLRNLTADADLRLIKDSNNNGVAEASEVIGTSLNGGTTNETIFKSSLAAGTYFIQVKRVAGTPSYKLLVKTDYAGNSFFNARNLGTFTGTKTFTDRVDSADDKDDFYKIVLTSTKTVSATTTGGGDVDLELAVDTDKDGVYDVGQDFIHRSNNPNTSTENLGSFTLNAGTYYIRVFRGLADGTYTTNIKIS